MITLEQIRLLESKITRAVELIRVLKEENGTLRKGLESAQKRMRELEALVDGFKSDQKEIESVILRTLHHLDELEESVHSSRKVEPAGKTEPAAHAVPHSADPRPVPPVPVAHAAAAPAPKEASAEEAQSAKEELDIF